MHSAKHAIRSFAEQTRHFMTTPNLNGLDVAPTRRQVLAGLAGLVSVGSAYAQAQFPARPIMIMAPGGPGGGTDQVARLMRLVLMQEELSPRPVEVINGGGGGGAIALAELISRHRADPYMVMVTAGALLSAPIAQKSPFRLTATEPLARLTVDQMIVAVPQDSPFANIDEFLGAFRRDPGSITWCGGSAGGMDHIFAGLIAEACGLQAADLRFVAYSGGGAASAAMLGGQVSAGVTGYSEWRGHIEEGRIRVLAAGAAQRFGAKDIPILREAGIDVVLQNWRGVFAPPGLSPDHLAWWLSTIERMRTTETWQNLLAKHRWDDGYLPQEEFRSTLQKDEIRFTQLLAKLGIGESFAGSSPMGPYAFPAIIGVAGAAAIGATVAERARSNTKIAPAGAEDDDEAGGPAPVWTRFLAGAALVLAYLGALSLVGFVIATPVFVLAVCLLMRTKAPIRDTIAAIGITVAVWLLFTRLLYVALP
jgi:putative tricarboxylic transport membrane protein